MTIVTPEGVFEYNPAGSKYTLLRKSKKLIRSSRLLPSTRKDSKTTAPCLMRSITSQWRSDQIMAFGTDRDGSTTQYCLFVDTNLVYQKPTCVIK